ncbi:BLUF domain-containing protein [Roseovarius salis]|uniref:BLUF domain-containing protein n=1 Tax=Roseovarius salis TaxID=3376063 RepID=UPI0037C8B2DC
MTEIVALCYCSRPVGFSFQRVEEILQESRRNNATAKVTGALIYDNWTFLQWIEGEKANVRQIFERINNDSRHTDIRILTVRKLNDRWFPDWSMTAAVTEGQTLRGLRLVPHVSLKQFDPFQWSQSDTIRFMKALSDYLTRRPAPASHAASGAETPEPAPRDPLTVLDAYLSRLP